MADRIRRHGGSQPVRGRRRGDSQRRVPVGVVRREGLTGRRLGMQQRDRSAERKAWLGPLLAVAVTLLHGQVFSWKIPLTFVPFSRPASGEGTPACCISSW